MKYVQRDSSGGICGIYANPQPQPDGNCLTEKIPLQDDDPEIVAFFTRPIPKSLSDGELAALLVKQNVIPQSVIDAAVTDSQAVKA